MPEHGQTYFAEPPICFIGRFGKHLLSRLLTDQTLAHNISWQTNQYEALGEGYGCCESIKVRFISGDHSNVLTPRVNKSVEEQDKRSRDKAEVFTPSWVCNKQNNLIDDQWFGKPGTFNTETDNGWNPSDSAVQYPKGKTWRDYVLLNRLEVSCGEAPYLTSRYDTVTGEYIPVKRRIGLLDRKLRVITENCGLPAEWKPWATKAVQSIYGYDWQGDNVLLARENILFSVAEAYQDAFFVPLSNDDLLSFAHVISWNIWQMDGIKGVIPNSCHDIPEPQLQYEQVSLFAEEVTKETKMIPCEGCKTGNIHKHTGIYCKIMDWETHKAIPFADIMKEAQK